MGAQREVMTRLVVMGGGASDGKRWLHDTNKVCR